MINAPGVYGESGSERAELVHPYQGGEYGLEDIPELFLLGRLESDELAEEAVLVLTTHELKQLKVRAYAESFDYEEGFIEMCLEMNRWAEDRPQESFRFIANF